MVKPRLYRSPPSPVGPFGVRKSPGFYHICEVPSFGFRVVGFRPYILNPKSLGSQALDSGCLRAESLRVGLRNPLVLGKTFGNSADPQKLPCLEMRNDSFGGPF